MLISATKLIHIVTTHGNFLWNSRTPCSENMSLFPRSNIELWITDLLSLIDKTKLLLCASCIVRFANRLQKNQERHPIIILVLFFDEHHMWHTGTDVPGRPIVKRGKQCLKVVHLGGNHWMLNVVHVTFATDTFRLMYQMDQFNFLHSLYNFFGLVIGNISSLESP